MSNGFFNATGKPIDGSEIASAEIRDEFTAIAAGFDKLPTLTGNAYEIVYVNASGSAMDVVGGSGLLKLSTTGIPTVAALGTGVETALAVNVGSAGAPVLFNGAGGTPSSMTGTNITGTAAGLTAGVASAVSVGGITGLGTGVATALGVNVGSAGAPVLFNGAGGTPSSMTGTNISGTAAGLTAGAVARTGITGLGTGVATALGVNVGSAGAPVLFNGAGGTPSSMTGTNITGTASGLTAGAASAVAVGGVTGLGTGVATALAVNVGSAGAPVTNGGALGTPASGNLANCTGYPATASGHGQCRLTKSGANLLLSPYGGNKLIINGVSETIPDAGVTLGGSVAADAFYYIYAYMSGATMTLEASTTARATSTTAGNKGVEIKSGDDTRTLVGAAYNQTDAWYDVYNSRSVMSWFNRKPRSSRSWLAASRTTTSAAIAEIHTDGRAYFICWADEAISASACGSASNSTAFQPTVMTIGWDGVAVIGGVAAQANTTATSLNSLACSSIAAAGQLTEAALHYVTIAGSVPSGTGTYTGGADNASRCEITLIANG